MTILPLLSLSGYFLFLAEFIAMRHRDICAESDARMKHTNRCCKHRIWHGTLSEWNEAKNAEQLYWNRGTK